MPSFSASPPTHAPTQLTRFLTYNYLHTPILGPFPLTLSRPHSRLAGHEVRTTTKNLVFRHMTVHNLLMTCKQCFMEAKASCISVSEPSFTKVPDNVIHLYIENTIILDCEASGVPKPNIRWTPGPLLDGRRQKIGNKLFKWKVQVQDSDNYTCTASNGVGAINTTTELLVRGKHFTFLRTRIKFT